MWHTAALGAALIVTILSSVRDGRAADPLRPASKRYAKAEAKEIPDFRRHVVPLMGRLGCNGRSCHGSFQGKGGFRLSLFGYDHKSDFLALTEGDEPRAAAKDAVNSPILYKPTHKDEHGGGERMRAGDWEHTLIRRWLESGARGSAAETATMTRLEVVPPELVVSREGEKHPLRVLATWSDGIVEDVTPLCRYQTNDESIAEIDADGVVTAKGPGDTYLVAFYDSGVAVAPVLMTRWFAGVPKSTMSAS